jgi:uncharacterized protein (DUF952 family)
MNRCGCANPPPPKPAKRTLVFKVLRPAEWAAFEAAGTFAGSPDDRRDGFIHLSTAAQLAGTIDRHFAGETEVVILAFEPADLGDSLKWEPSRGGELFPHHYGPLDLTAVRQRRAVKPIGSG